MDERSTLYGWLIKIGLVVVGLAILKGALYLQGKYPEIFKEKTAQATTKYILKPIAYLYVIIVVIVFIVI